MRLIDADKLLMDIEKYHVSDGKFQHWVQIQPTIEPETCEDTVSRNSIIQKLNTMDRYVSEELRLCDTDKKFPKNEVFIVDDVYEEIAEQLPSVQPEITRCRDCKHLEIDNIYHDCWCDGKKVFFDHYCGYAERRTDGSD